MSKDPVPKAIANVWSEPVNGLAGRLLVEFEDLKPGLRHGVYLELKNHSFDPIAVPNQPLIHSELFDTSGKPISTKGYPASGPIPIPQWAIVPRDAYIGFRVDMQIVGVPTREQGMVLLAIGGKNWEVRAGAYELKTALVFKKEDEGPQNQWVGELELPPVEVVVTTQMLAVN